MTSTFDNRMERVAPGERLSPDEIRELSSLPDILGLGMLADALRRVMHGTQVTYLRVAACAFDRPFADAVPEAAREIRITGSPDSLESALSAVRNARAVAGTEDGRGLLMAPTLVDMDRTGRWSSAKLREAVLDDRQLRSTRGRRARRLDPLEGWVRATSTDHDTSRVREWHAGVHGASG